MIINKIIIRNFRSYYGDNTFEFKDGLTLIIGNILISFKNAHLNIL